MYRNVSCYAATSRRRTICCSSRCDSAQRWSSRQATRTHIRIESYTDYRGCYEPWIIIKALAREVEGGWFPLLLAVLIVEWWWVVLNLHRIWLDCTTRAWEYQLKGGLGVQKLLLWRNRWSEHLQGCWSPPICGCCRSIRWLIVSRRWSWLDSRRIPLDRSCWEVDWSYLHRCSDRRDLLCWWGCTTRGNGDGSVGGSLVFHLAAFGRRRGSSSQLQRRVWRGISREDSL